MVELSQAMADLYNGSEFTLLRNQVASILNIENPVKEPPADIGGKISFKRYENSSSKCL
jgi:hypothetical protein